MVYTPPALAVPSEVPGFRRGVDFDSDAFVYHYTRWETLLDIAATRSLRLTPTPLMNDPRESKRWFLNKVIGPGDLDADAWARAEAFRRNVKIAAFASDQSADSFGAGYARPRMWAQYAANHTGACIIFHRGALTQQLTEQFGDADHRGWKVDCGGVEYREVEALTASLGSDISEFFFANWKDAFFTKHADWRDEREFRLVLYSPADEKPAYLNIESAAVALVLGGDFEDSHLPVARTFSDALAISGRVARLQWDRLRYRLLPIGEENGRWVVCQSKEAVAMTLRIGKPQPKSAS